MEFKGKWVKSFGMMESQRLGAVMVAAFFLVSVTYVSTSKTSIVRLPFVNSSWKSSSMDASAFTSPAAETTTDAPYADPSTIDDLFVDQENIPPTSDADFGSAIVSKTSHQLGNSSTTFDAVPERANVSKTSDQLGNSSTTSDAVSERPNVSQTGDHLGNSSATSDAVYERINISKTSNESGNFPTTFDAVYESANVSKMSEQLVNSSATSDAVSEGDNDSKTSHQLGNSSTTSNAVYESVNGSKMSHVLGNSTTISDAQDEASQMTQQLDAKPPKKPPCDFSNRRSDTCDLEGDIRVIGAESSVLALGSLLEKNESYQIRPYARKTDLAAMADVRRVSVKSSNSDGAPHCTLNHTVPGIVFSVAGYVGNYFHDFSDVLVPLFLTSHQYGGEVQFLVTNYRWWFMNKYRHVLAALSRYEIVDYDHDPRVHCFRHVTVGLTAHNDLTIDPARAPGGLSMVDFTRFMRRAYSLDRDSPVRLGAGGKPRLLIVARGHTRRFANAGRIRALAAELGYEVVVAEAGRDVAEFARVVNSCDVMMGVHGAGLTNLVFLPPHAILIQVIPWGRLEWVASTYFELPAHDMELRYLKYAITEEESTLTDLYPRDHAVFKDPLSYHKLGWDNMRAIYLDKQNVRLNLRRFRPVLEEALRLLRES